MGVAGDTDQAAIAITTILVVGERERGHCAVDMVAKERAAHARGWIGNGEGRVKGRAGEMGKGKETTQTRETDLLERKSGDPGTGRTRGEPKDRDKRQKRKRRRRVRSNF